MKKFETVTSKVATIPLADIDTDKIIPARYLTSTSREGYGEHAFEPLRGDPQFFLNKPAMSGAEILAVGHNFGCGSSREHAVWAIQGVGIKVIIGSSFADIFSNNSAKNGLLLVTIDKKSVEEIIAQAENPGLSLTVDLVKNQISFQEGGVIEFTYDAFSRTCLLEGMDEMDYLLKHTNQVQTFFASQENFVDRSSI